MSWPLCLPCLETPRVPGPDRPRLASRDASDIGCRGNGSCNKSPFLALQGYGSYGWPRPSITRVHPSGPHYLAAQSISMAQPQFTFTNQAQLSSSSSRTSWFERASWRTGFLQTIISNLLKACELPRVESRSQSLGQTGLSDCQDTPIFNPLL